MELTAKVGGEIDSEELKRIELDILLDIHAFCEANNLAYYLWGGTLLGAIRHKGFIPWDDDIDIAMPRNDYEFFCKHYSSEEYGVSSCTTDCRHPYWHAKAYNKRTIKEEPIFYKDAFSLGIDVDIFALDEYDDFDEVMKSAKWRKLQIKNYGRSLLSDNNTSFKRKLAGFVYRNILRVDANKTAVTVNKKGQSYKKGSGLMLYADANIRKPLRLEKAWFANRTLHVFEGKMVYVPGNFDALLRACYGEYMTPPPAEKQVSHHTFRVFYK